MSIYVYTNRHLVYFSNLIGIAHDKSVNYMQNICVNPLFLRHPVSQRLPVGLLMLLRRENGERRLENGRSACNHAHCEVCLDLHSACLHAKSFALRGLLYVD